MVRQNPRRPSSASPTSRPRRVAGRAAPSLPPDGVHEADDADATTEIEAPPPPGPVAHPEPEPEPEPEMESEPPAELESDSDLDVYPSAGAGLVDSPRTTRILLAVIALLAVVALAGGIFLMVDDDPSSSSASDTGSDDESVVVADADNPVRITGEDAQVAVAQAAQAAYTIVATSYQDYGAQVDEAAELMTTEFAEEYRQTAADVEDAIVAGKTEVQVSVVAQGVVRADQEQVQALVFLNMFTTRDGEESVFTPYRVLITMVNTDQGWLVANLDTD